MADSEGFYELWLQPSRPLLSDRLWHEVELELLDPQRAGQGVVRRTGMVLVPPPSAQFGVISDIDDTVIQTDVANVLRMARTVFLGNAHTRLPFHGVAAFYRALQAGKGGSANNPLFYVSSSPWNLYDLLVEFFKLNDIPIGPLLLRDWGRSSGELLPTGHHEHKLQAIEQILDLYNELPFILIGDSTQEDPEIYHEVMRRYPQRILAIYIRNVNRAPERIDAIRALGAEVIAGGATLILADDTLAIAQHAAQHGWIDFEQLPAVQAEKAADEAPPGSLEALLGEDTRDKGPTVRITGEAPPEVEADAIEAALESDDHRKAPPTVIVEGDQEPPQTKI